MRPLPIASAWSLFSPEESPRVELARWSHQARTFLAAEVSLVQTITDPAGLLPPEAALEFDVAPSRGGPHGATRVRVITLPLAAAPEALAAANEGVAAIGGAGFDALIPRARRLWQVAAAPVGGGDPRAPLVVAALIALVLLAPVVPPGGGTVFGVRGARVRLEAQGWG